VTFAANYVGRSLLRNEDLRLLRGKGQFVDDLHRDGMVHAAILRSQVAHGRLRAIRAEAAKAMRGVHGVFTAADVMRMLGGSVPVIPLRLGAPQLLPFEQPVIVAEKVRYVGEPLAIVVADSRALAEDALAAIEVDIEPLPVVATREDASRDASLLFEAEGSNTAIIYTATKGDASVRAPYVRRERFSVHRHTAVCLEPRGLLAVWDGDKTRLTLLGAAKVPFTTRRTLAQNMDLPEDCVEAIEVDVGGGFGVRGDYHVEDFLVPFAARRLGRPVKWIEDRLENLMTANHARECDAEMEIACDRDGTVLALRGEVWVDSGAYIRAAATVQPRNAAQFATGPYRIANVQVRSSIVVTNKTPSGVYRGPGRFEADFFR
jgi:carbon-monoxide dehydrogenase large subunit